MATAIEILVNEIKTILIYDYTSIRNQGPRDVGPRGSRDQCGYPARDREPAVQWRSWPSEFFS